MGGFGGFGLAGPAPRDVLIILGVLFVTFALRFFESTAIVPAMLQLTPRVWMQGWVWELVTYPFIGAAGSGLFFLLDLLILYMFAHDVYFGLYRRHFWRLRLRPGQAGRRRGREVHWLMYALAVLFLLRYAFLPA